MKKNIALCILLCSLFFGAQAQPRYEIVTEAICWTVSAVDSSLLRVVLQSTRTSERITIGYYNAAGAEVTVTGGTLALGWCNNCTVAYTLPPSMHEPGLNRAVIAAILPRRLKYLQKRHHAA